MDFGKMFDLAGKPDSEKSPELVQAVKLVEEFLGAAEERKLIDSFEVMELGPAHVKFVIRGPESEFRYKNAGVIRTAKRGKEPDKTSERKSKHDCSLEVHFGEGRTSFLLNGFRHVQKDIGFRGWAFLNVDDDYYKEHKGSTALLRIKNFESEKGDVEIYFGKIAEFVVITAERSRQRAAHMRQIKQRNAPGKKGGPG